MCFLPTFFADDSKSDKDSPAMSRNLLNALFVSVYVYVCVVLSMQAENVVELCMIDITDHPYKFHLI